MNALGLASYGYIDTSRRVFVDFSVNESVTPFLTKAIVLPVNGVVDESFGISQSDIIIRSAIIAGIADLRANPWLLDYVFASLPKDPLTRSEYGEKELAQAKKWFLSTDIPILMNFRVDEPKLPCVTISLSDSTEVENTLSDTHYVPIATNDSSWPALTAPFDPASYDAITGTMVVPSSVGDTILLNPGQVLIDNIGREFSVLSVTDKYTLLVAPNTIADWHNAVLKPKRPAFSTKLESASFKETYSIGCHAQGESTQLLYLHSIVVFVLLRYREILLEARGLERTSITSGVFSRNESFEQELVFSRYINITAFVRNSWPKMTTLQIAGLQQELDIGKANQNGPWVISNEETEDTAPWETQDPLTFDP